MDNLNLGNVSWDGMVNYIEENSGSGRSGAEIDDTNISSTKTWSSNKMDNEIKLRCDVLSSEVIYNNTESYIISSVPLSSPISNYTKIDIIFNHKSLNGGSVSSISSLCGEVLTEQIIDMINYEQESDFQYGCLVSGALNTLTILNGSTINTLELKISPSIEVVKIIGVK